MYTKVTLSFSGLINLLERTAWFLLKIVPVASLVEITMVDS